MKNIFFTGERVIDNGTTPNNIIEHHLARYNFAKKFVKNKTVLDIACGTGYGTFELASSTVKQIIGADISKEAILYAKENYKQNNLSFIEMNCKKINLKNNSVDVVVSFETIEHIKEFKEFLLEVSRILKKGGIFICSSPNKKITSPYTKKPLNKYHIKEFYISELKIEINKFLSSKEVYGQFFLKDNLKFRIKKFIGTFEPIFFKKIRKKIIGQKVVCRKKDEYLVRKINKTNKLSPEYFIIVAHK